MDAGPLFSEFYFAVKTFYSTRTASRSIAPDVFDPGSKHFRHAPSLPRTTSGRLGLVTVIHVGNASEPAFGEHDPRILQDSLGLRSITPQFDKRGAVGSEQ